MGFSRQEYWGGLPCLPPGDVLDQKLEHMSPALQAVSLLSEPFREGHNNMIIIIKFNIVLITVF